MEGLPEEIFEKFILQQYLMNDGPSIGRLSLCSQNLYQRINRNCPKLWKSLINQRWTVPTTTTTTSIIQQQQQDNNNVYDNDDDDDYDDDDDSDYCLEYIRRYEIDMIAIKLLNEMRIDLQSTLNIPPTQTQTTTTTNATYYYLDGSTQIGQAWDHLSWKQLLTYRSEVMDILKIKSQLKCQKRYQSQKSQKRQSRSSSNFRDDEIIDDNNNNNQNQNEDDEVSIITTKTTIEERLYGFLASRCLQNIHFAECLHLWKDIDMEREQQQIQQQQIQQQQNEGGISNSILIEQYALLICRIQQSPIELMQNNNDEEERKNENNNSLDISINIIKQLDDIANTCMEQIQQQQQQQGLKTTTTTTDTISEEEEQQQQQKLHIINDVIINQLQFVGNSSDYYNYRNSLLCHVLKTKKGIPITLCILYVCICRRCNICVHLIGLPGHVVLGYYPSSNKENNNNNNGLLQQASSSSSSSSQPMFFDVFRKGTKLSIDDCISICNSYGYPWNPDYLIPLQPQHILQRMLNNLNNCHFQAMTLNRPFHSELFFQQRALDTIHKQSSDIARPLVDRISQEIPLTLSPDLLRHYGLLSSSQTTTTTATTTTAAATTNQSQSQNDDDDDD